jgi:hypothetical protein
MASQAIAEILFMEQFGEIGQRSESKGSRPSLKLRRGKEG